MSIIILFWLGNTCSFRQVDPEFSFTILLVRAGCFSLFLRVAIENSWRWCRLKYLFLSLYESVGFATWQRTSFSQKHSTLKNVLFRVTIDTTNNNLLRSFLLIIPFLWQEKELLTRQVRVHKGKSTLFIIITKEKMPILAEKKQLSIHLFPHRSHRFHHPLKSVRVQPVRNEHQSV